MTTMLQVKTDSHVEQTGHIGKDDETFSIKFSHEEHLFAQISSYEGRTTIGIKEVEADLTCKSIAEIDITEHGPSQPHGLKVAFDHIRPFVFAYSFWTEMGMNCTYLATLDLEEGIINSNMVSEGKCSPSGQSSL